MSDLSQLHQPFPRERISWRIQGTPIKRNDGWIGMALAYIDARDVMDRLDEVCGPAGWQSEITETTSGRVLCTLSILTESGWVRKTDGAGSTQVEAEKGGISDSLKRAAVQWGVGRYLYEMDAPWVPCEVNEKGGKVYWKKWAVDPWTKVKAPAQVRIEQPVQQEKPQPTADKLIAWLEAAPSLDALKKRWERAQQEAAGAASLPEVRGAYDAKWRELDNAEFA